MTDFLNNLLSLSLEAAPWLVLGLVIGGMIKALVPIEFLQKHLSGNGIISITKAAVFGAPLPLCSCGVIPAALGLRRAGASKSATVSFLVSTPETGIDSVTISYALLGPFMAIVRPIAAIASAITAGLLVGSADDVKSSKQHVHNSGHDHDHDHESDHDHTSHEDVVISCCGSVTADTKAEAAPSCCSAEPKKDENKNFMQEAWAGIVYSFDTLFVDVIFWLVIGLVFAALVQTFVPITFLAEWGSGLPAMLIMLVIGIPMYVCATASTPIAAGLLLAGVSPGTAMVFLMAGPATNISTLGIIGKELGRRSLIAYVGGVSIVALITGYIVDYLVELWKIDIQGQISHSESLVPSPLAWLSLMILIGWVIKLKVIDPLKTSGNLKQT